MYISCRQQNTSIEHQYNINTTSILHLWHALGMLLTLGHTWQAPSDHCTNWCLHLLMLLASSVSHLVFANFASCVTFWRTSYCLRSVQFLAAHVVFSLITAFFAHQWLLAHKMAFGSSNDFSLIKWLLTHKMAFGSQNIPNAHFSAFWALFSILGTFGHFCNFLLFLPFWAIFTILGHFGPFLGALSHFLMHTRARTPTRVVKYFTNN